MKAAILEKLNSPLLVEDVKIPALECGQVLVKMIKATICGAQIGEISGVKGDDPFLPHLMGHEGSGVVWKVGAGVSRFKFGDHVVCHWRKGPGIEAVFPRYKWRDGFVGAGKVTTFSEFSVISENRVTKIDEDIPFGVASLLGCAVTTGLGLINNEAKLKIGQSIAVMGCGGVGLNVIQGAKMVAANPIIAVDIHSAKLNMARAYGATHIIMRGVDKSKLLFRDVMKDIVGKSGVDVFVECTGKIGNIETAYELTAPGGKTIMVGQPHIDEALTINQMVNNFKGKTLLDSQGGLTDPAVDIPRYLKLYREGLLALDNFITDSFPLDEINEAIKIVRIGKTGRVVLDISEKDE